MVLSPEIRGDCNGAENCILSTIIRFPETKHEITGSVQEGSNGNLEMRVGLKKTTMGRVPNKIEIRPIDALFNVFKIATFSIYNF